MLAHIREVFALSNNSWGSLRMTVELKEADLSVGRRRVAPLDEIQFDTGALQPETPRVQVVSGYSRLYRIVPGFT